jgi:gliding motility-associated-like protein
VSKKILIFFLLISMKSFAQLPDNIGFEDGSFNHWNCSAGTISSNGVITLSGTNPVPTRHTLFSKQSDAALLDPYGNFPVLCPNGSNYSIRLGNSDVHAEAESVSYTFIVPTTSTFGYSITFNYAVVFQNPDHTDIEQPKFTARVFDITDNKYVECPYFNFIAGSALPGFKLSSTKAAGGSATAKEAAIYYKDWSSASINLREYTGKLLRLEFTTNDCTKGGHFGYAYLDVDEGKNAAPITGNSYCAGEPSVTLKGPDGYAVYEWYNADLSQLLGTSRNLEIFPAPPDNTHYTLKVYPYAGLGCPDVLYTVVNKVDNGYRLKLVDTIRGCPELGVDLTKPYVTAGSTPGFILNYFTDASKTTHISDSTKVFLQGNYFIEGLSPDGCSNTLSVYVKMMPPSVSATEPAPVHYPATVDITKTIVKQPGASYSYYSDASTTIPLVDSTAVNASGKYFIKVKNIYGCEAVTSVTVTILPPPPYIVTGPNVFTPNSDGVNDYFNLHIEGFVQFNNLKVFNRYGQLIFTTTSQGYLWDGTFNGRPLPAGAYYWIFDGTDTYYHTPIKKSGSISIIR